ncbi:hypothetical protein EK21DRAFT_95694 [Setomelanomma holmii]|uniref:Uncharacterized protein n=1 Tax=Setomelanomma holmii TaxID=210430 RepID=A0A9P4GVS4_9PLEO|nr:hypothetical protein EK21DRAFT_95694 [Setomelanomma holmii]
MSDCSETTCYDDDRAPFYLDIGYSAFKEDIVNAGHRDDRRERYRRKKISRAYLSLEKYRTCEEYELKFLSKWRGDHLYQLNKEQPLSFKEDIDKRYAVWHSIYDGAIDALESHFSVNGFSTDEDDIRLILLCLWAFLPQEFSRYGTHIDLQKRHVAWMTQRTNIQMRLKIDNFLTRLVARFCDHDKGALADRIQLYEKDSECDPKESETLKTDILESGAYRLLVKRLLLQTPLLFWPAVFKSGVSRYFEGEIKPSEVYYCGEGDLVVQCGNTRCGGGYEISAGADDTKSTDFQVHEWKTWDRVRLLSEEVKRDNHKKNTFATNSCCAKSLSLS